MTNPDEMAAVVSAITAYHQKRIDRHLIIKSINGHDELHPRRCAMTRKLAIELPDDLRAIVDLVISMKSEFLGVEL